MSKLLQDKKKFAALGFLSPYLVFYFMFMVYPAIRTFLLSLQKWELLGGSSWVGLNNYIQMFSDDKFWASFWHTIYFVLLSTPPLVVLGLGLALVLNMKFPGRKFFQILFFAPYVLNVSVISITWEWIFQSEFGLINSYLQSFGLPKISWLARPATAMPSVVIATIWWTVGFNMILFLAGLQDIPRYLYEAAKIDGANIFQRFFHITVPLLKRTIFLVVILQVIASFKIFGQVYIMTGGGPHGSTRVLVQYIYRTAFRYFNMGYASAMAFILFLAIFIVSIFQIILGQKRGMA